MEGIAHETKIVCFGIQQACCNLERCRRHFGRFDADLYVLRKAEKFTQNTPDVSIHRGFDFCISAASAVPPAKALSAFRSAEGNAADDESHTAED